MLVSYHVGCTADEDQLTADLMPYVVSEEGQAAAAEVAGAAPNSGALPRAGPHGDRRHQHRVLTVPGDLAGLAVAGR